MKNILIFISGCVLAFFTFVLLSAAISETARTNQENNVSIKEKQQLHRIIDNLVHENDKLRGENNALRSK